MIRWQAQLKRKVQLLDKYLDILEAKKFFKTFKDGGKSWKLWVRMLRRDR